MLGLEEHHVLMKHTGPHFDTQPQIPHLGPVKLCCQLHNFILPLFLLHLTSFLTQYYPLSDVNYS